MMRFLGKRMAANVSLLLTINRVACEWQTSLNLRLQNIYII